MTVHSDAPGDICRLNSHSTLANGSCHHPHSAEGEAEALRDHVTAQAHTPWQVAELGIKASCFCKKISPPHPTLPVSYWETGFLKPC